MCEKRSKKIRKGSNSTRLREARRLHRLQNLVAPPSPASSEESTPPASPHVDKVAQGRLILELAWKTVALMHKNKIIQQKIIDLQKETSEFMKSVMSTPENRVRYLEHVRVHGPIQQGTYQIYQNNVPIKIEPMF